jgi:ribose 5-phosphate isomerase B
VEIAFGTDEETDVTRSVVEHLRSAGHVVSVVAPGAEWPEVGRAVGAAVASGAAGRGVVCCWTGTGVSIAANKVVGARAALCTDAETARGARRWNDANILALGLRLTSTVVAREVVDAFLATDPDAAEAGAIGRLEAGHGGEGEPDTAR